MEKQGENSRQTFLPYGQQYIDDDDIQAVIETLKSDFLTTGPKIKEFEDKICENIGCKYAVAISNGTAALHAACFAAGITDGDEVITSAITFAASSNAVLYCGGTPIFADIEPDTYNIDPEDIKRKITDKTKAIIPVHFTGQPCNMDEIMRIAKEHKLIVIEDAAHALGAEYKSRMIGNISDMTIFSFHPVKHITTGEGGVITTNDEKLYEKLMMFRSHGITRDKDKLTKDEGSWYYEQQFLGYNYRITDIQAALGISQLKKLDYFLERRRYYVKMYNEAFKDFEGIVIPYQINNVNSAWHLYIIQLELEKLTISRRQVVDELIKRNIGVNVHYIPVYYHPYYKEIGYKKGLCKIAENLYERIITIPLFPKMKEDDVWYVIENIKEIINNNRAN